MSSNPEQSRSGPIGEILRLQTELQARLAKETLGYLRRLQCALSPLAPGTAFSADVDAELRANTRPGGTVVLRLEVENRQRVHSVVTPMLSPLADETGRTWLPSAETEPSSALLSPGQSTAIVFRLSIPLELAPGNYRGTLLLQGIRPRGISVTILVKGAGLVEPATRSPAKRRAGK